MEKENSKKNFKKIVLIYVPVVLLLAGFVFLSIKTKNKKESENASNSKIEESKVNSNQNEKTNNETNPGGTITEDQSIASDEEKIPEKQSEEKPDEAQRQEIIAYFNQNADKFLPVPPKNDKWDTPSFYFVGNSKVYVENYALDSDLAGVQFLFDVKKVGNTFEFKKLAEFKEGEEDWVLIEGEDNFSDFIFDNYEFDQQKEKWVMIDEMDEADLSGDEIEAEIEEDGATILP